MSLRVWLPLTKDLRQQGLDNVTVTNNGATFNSAGKLGGCYSFDGSDDYISLNSSAINSCFTGSSQFFSVAMWIYRADATRAILFGDYSLSGAINFNIELTTSNYLRFYWAGAPDWNAGTVTANAWTHICYTYDGGTLKIYTNGALASTNTITLTSKNKNSGDWYLGRDSRTGTTAFNGKLNDFRIYDNCLTPEEVKKIAQGLVLHYPLNHQGLGNVNLITNSKLDESWTYPSSSYSDKYSPITTIIPSASQYTLSFDAKSTVNGDKIRTHYYSPNTTTTCVSNQGITKTAADGNMDFTLTTQWQRYWVTYAQTETTAVKHLICPRLVSGQGTGTISVKNVKFEEGAIATPWCPNSSDIGSNTTIEYDCSGFCNNGTRIGNITWSTDTPKYQVSQNFTIPGTIQVNNFSPNNTDFKNSYTIAVWIKTTTTNGMICGGSNSYYDIWIYSNSIFLNIGDGASDTNAFLNNGVRVPISSINDGQWHHVVITGNGSTAILYIDGNERGRAGTYRAFQCTTLYINGWSTANEYHFDGQMSDFRIYATALSAEDIQTLYQARNILN